jgi:hypothetical protein
MALWDNVIGYGTHAARPAAGAPGALYFESDTGDGYRDNGTSWDQITAPAPVGGVLTVYHPTTDLTLTSAMALVVVATPLTVTLPDATACAGQVVIVKNQGGGSDVGTTVNPPDGQGFDEPSAGGDYLSATAATFTYYSDGVLWLRTAQWG